ncbi:MULTISPECIES: DUF2191 domain-containing protein [unclassified Micromonospora]|uniref:DUF2191 domain-containing protein n=1 Tax=unclassified Micromonospora TaxID=2617518 RepID=UPI00098D4875|nr:MULTISPECIES: DUF2191 domain-containing protein [unclassified Micromonospora]MDI5940132.1 type II toxin-antitoxin system VapB family antitoxin [Micromonospora sp. DH15]OON29018.1 DUF2191 domain-containing protein [Micromonospora sp. Rc5]
MSRTIIVADDQPLGEAAKILGATIKRITTSAALKSAVDRKKRREFADWLKSGGLPGLAEPVVGERNNA